MSDIKDYRAVELKSYVIANLLIFFLTHYEIVLSPNVLESNSGLMIIISFINIAIVSSIFYAFIFITDSLFSGDLKFHLLYLFWKKPGEKIFAKIEKSNKDMRFSKNDVMEKYKEIYANMPSDKKRMNTYQNQRWYEIYHLYKQVAMVAVSAKEFRLCRDMYIATMNALFMYLIFCFPINVLTFSFVFTIYMVIMLVLTNIAARIKASKWVYNVIAHDVMNGK